MGNSRDIDHEFLVAQALNELEADDNGVWSAKRKVKSLRKFGRKTDVGATFRTIQEVDTPTLRWLLPDENLITHVASTDAADTNVIDIEGHYGDGSGNLLFSVQQVTLAGRTPVALTRTLSRCSRMGDDFTRGVAIAGDVHVYEGASTSVTNGLPNDLSFAHNVIKGTLGQQQSYKGATSFSSSDAGILMNLIYSLQRKTSASADFRMQRKPAAATIWRPFIGDISLNSAGQAAVWFPIQPYEIIRPNWDVRIVSAASSANVSVDATMFFLLAGRYAGAP